MAATYDLKLRRPQHACGESAVSSLLCPTITAATSALRSTFLCALQAASDDMGAAQSSCVPRSQRGTPTQTPRSSSSSRQRSSDRRASHLTKGSAPNSVARPSSRQQSLDRLPPPRVALDSSSGLDRREVRVAGRHPNTLSRSQPLDVASKPSTSRAPQA